jgi:membrane fusion protein, multidrug efflux system
MAHDPGDSRGDRAGTLPARAESSPLTGEQFEVTGPLAPLAEKREAEKHQAEKHRRLRRWILLGVGIVIALVLAWIFGWPWLQHYLHNVSTDDAYVNGHSSAISARIQGHVVAIYVDDNDRVKTGDLLLSLDAEPYRVAVEQKRAALAAADADLDAARAQVRALAATARANWFSLVNAQEQVRYQRATIRANVANVRVQEANLKLAQEEKSRVSRLVKQQAAPREELDQRRADEEVARQKLANAREAVRQTRAALGLPPDESDPTAFPADLEQNYSAVQMALSKTVESLAQIGVPLQLDHLTPASLRAQLLASPTGDLNAALARFMEKAPAVLQAQATQQRARADLKNAELNLSYTQIHAPIDGQVVKRNINPGNNVAVGQSLLAVRSLTALWIDANFRETQLDYLRIGQAVDVHVDAYPHTTFHGRVEGFSAGTGSANALLPPENATGNFVKIVQRLPVRITIDPADLTDETPLFIGLSATPSVKFQEPARGPNAGKRLRASLRPEAVKP